MTPEERQAEQRLNIERAIDLRGMVVSRDVGHPLTADGKRSALFWHDRFATSSAEGAVQRLDVIGGACCCAKMRWAILERCSGRWRATRRC
jgi:hypothetical protein